MKNWNGIFLVLVCFYGVPVFSAGGMDIGGGTGWACFNNLDVVAQVRKNPSSLSDEGVELIQSLVPVDLWEARLPRSRDLKVPTLQNPRDDQSTFDFLEQILAGVDRSIPTLGLKLRYAEKHFSNDKIVWYPLSLQVMNDIRLPIEKGPSPFCAPVTLAVQMKIEGAYFLHMDPRLYRKMDRIGQATLWLHEYLYLLGREVSHSSSDATRKLLGQLLLASGQVNISEVTAMAVDLGFLSAEEAMASLSDYRGYPLPVFNSSGKF